MMLAERFRTVSKLFFLSSETGPGTVYNPGTSYRGMPYDLECKDCVTTFKSSADFEAHFRETHGNDRPYKCKVSGSGGVKIGFEGSDINTVHQLNSTFFHFPVVHELI